MRWLVSEIGHIMGGVSMEEGQRLGGFAADVDPELAIVEVGSQGGASTSWLAMGSAKGKGATVTAVDLWDAQPEGRWSRYTTTQARERFMAQMAYIVAAGHVPEGLVRPIQGHSLEVAADWDQPIGLLHIDAMHTVEACGADLRAWTPHVVPGGIVVVHDWSMKSVRSAVKAWLPDSGFVTVGTYRWDYRPKSMGQWVGRRR